MGKRLRSGFYWRGGVIWRRTDAIDGLPRSTGCRDPEAAYIWDSERQRIRSNPAYAASHSARLGDWGLKMLKLKGRSRAAGTLRMYEQKLGHFVRVWGEDAALASVTAPLVDAFIEQRRDEGAKSNTIARELTCLRQLLKHAKRAGEFPSDIGAIMPIAFAAEYVPVTRTLKMGDLPKLWTALNDDRERAFLALALGLAMDKGDIERAEVGDYDQVRGVMRVRGTKTDTRDAEVPVLEHVRELVEWAVTQLPIVWPDSSHGIGKACKRAGLPHLSPKDLRRTAASWLMASGADQTHVSRFLRHKGDGMVRKVYGQITAEELGTLLRPSAESLQQTSGPLGGTAYAADLKGDSPASESGSRRKESRTYATGSDVAGPVESAEALQRMVALPALEALVLAAEMALARRPVLAASGAAR